MFSKKRKKIHGLLIDAARLPETMCHYYRVIDFAAKWNLNTIVFRLTDDQGSCLRFKSHPELITHKHAFTPKELRAMVRHAQKRGILIIPEIESFGHSGYIFRSKSHRHLEDKGKDPLFTGLIPVHPEVLKLMKDLYREVASIFPGRFIHIGCDEVAWGGSKLSREALKKRGRSEIWADYINSLHQMIQDLGRETIIWADHVLREDTNLLEKIDQKIILYDWAYAKTDPVDIKKHQDRAIAAGFRIIGGPALGWSCWGVRWGAVQLGNIHAFSDVYRENKNPQALGVILTNWVPSRQIQGSIWDGLAYSAVAITEGSVSAQKNAYPRFVKKYYGSEWNQTWADLFQLYLSIAPNIDRRRPPNWPLWMIPQQISTWHTSQQLKSIVQNHFATPPPYRLLIELMERVESSIQKNWNDFQAFKLSAEYLEHIFWRNHVVTPDGIKKHGGTGQELIQLIASRDQAILKKLDEEWNQGRFNDTADKQNLPFNIFPQDHLLHYFFKTAAYSRQLVKKHSLFSKLLKIH